MANIEKRIARDGTVTYRARIRMAGRPEACATFRTRAKALEWWHRTNAEVRDGNYFKVVEAKKHTVGDMIDRYVRDVLPQKPRSLRKQTAQLQWWKKQIGCYSLADITPALIAEARDRLGRDPTLRGKQRSSATLVRYLAALSHAFSMAVKEWAWLEDSPMRRVTKPKETRGRARFLTDEERMRLLTACQNSKSRLLYTIVVVALSTGMRYSEIINLQWRDVDLDKGRIVLEYTKNGERRSIPLVGHALDLLKDLSKQRRLDTFYLFPGKNVHKPMEIRYHWEKALKEAQIPDFRFHDLRHTFASYLAMNKATLTELRILLGHKSSSMTARYSHLTESHGAVVVADMSSKIFKKPSDEEITEVPG